MLIFLLILVAIVVLAVILLAASTSSGGVTGVAFASALKWLAVALVVAVVAYPLIDKALS